jgi:2-keto-4-pentenoate hydratase
LAALARRQWEDYKARTPGTVFGESGPDLDLEAAYRLQAAVSKLRVDAGDRIVGYKVGCTGPGTVQQFGMHGPIRGCLYESEVRRSGAELDSGAYANLAIEGEMAVLIGAGGRPQAAFPVIELHHFVFRRPRRTLVELVANNGLNAGVVLPPAQWLSSDRYLTQPGSLEVSINGKRVGAGGLWPLAGEAAASISWLKEHLRSHDLTLATGDLVLAGTPFSLYPVVSGDQIHASIDGVPVTECRIV